MGLEKGELLHYVTNTQLRRLTMNFGSILKALAPVLAVALAAGVSGCDGAKFSINGDEGKKLAELDLTGKTPGELVLLGPDEVEVKQGEQLAITVDGDPEAVEAMRFSLSDTSLGILRNDKSGAADNKRAVVRVTMPAPREVVLAGSGKIRADALAPGAKVVVAGSGTIESASVSGDKLEVTLPGSGSFRAAGNVDELELTILGSGSAHLDAVKAGKAKVTMAGSGGATFASDGEVEATIVGSGTVTVKGRARCKVSAMGSGTLVCETPAEPASKAKPKA
jgi:Putative auto-transporter adhesin, head GIN domain